MASFTGHKLLNNKTFGGVSHTVAGPESTALDGSGRPEHRKSIGSNQRASICATSNAPAEFRESPVDPRLLGMFLTAIYFMCSRN